MKSLRCPYWCFSCNVYSREVPELKTQSDLYAGLSAHTYHHAVQNNISVNDDDDDIIITTTTAIELSLSGSSPYTSTDKTNKNKYT